MKNKPSVPQNSAFENPQRNRIVLILSILASLYWFIGKNTDVYHFAITGAIFELLWLPMLVLILLLPLLSILFLIQDKFNFRSMALYSILLLIPAILQFIIDQK
ncbi:hypothetical protein [Daejeonella sp. H1SJ63]|jgi:hypothetical protein|uniref:hypothetical protein n=1 Tax=Daejeonella sp. H1SJ63 TaxID=3034145 RepID=UPI0023EBA3DB|nr:hypothetical protein [Daejeonella sp. H1SJ63]